MINVLRATLGKAQIQQIDFIKDFGLQEKRKKEIIIIADTCTHV